MEIKNVSLEEHVDQYMEPLPTGFPFQNGSLQVYNLQEVSKYLKGPTPLLKPSYNLIIQLTEGYIEGQIGPNEIEITANTVLFIREGHIISRQKVSDNIDGFCMIIKNKALNKLLSDSYLLRLFNVDPIIPLSDDVCEWLTEANGLLHKELSRPDSNKEAVNSLFQALLHKLFSSAGTDYPLTREKEVAFKFRKLAHQYFVEQKELSFYARRLAVSENYLSRCVKETFEKPPKRMLIEISILQGQLLLQDFSKQITEVAYELNYNDPSYFGRLFKQVTNQTPSDYRDSIMQDLSES